MLWLHGMRPCATDRPDRRGAVTPPHCSVYVRANTSCRCCFDGGGVLPLLHQWRRVSSISNKHTHTHTHTHTSLFLFFVFIFSFMVNEMAQTLDLRCVFWLSDPSISAPTNTRLKFGIHWFKLFQFFIYFLVRFWFFFSDMAAVTWTTHGSAN